MNGSGRRLLPTQDGKALVDVFCVKHKGFDIKFVVEAVHRFFLFELASCLSRACFIINAGELFHIIVVGTDSLLAIIIADDGVRLAQETFRAFHSTYVIAVLHLHLVIGDAHNASHVIRATGHSCGVVAPFDGGALFDLADNAAANHSCGVHDAFVGAILHGAGAGHKSDKSATESRGADGGIVGTILQNAAFHHTNDGSDDFAIDFDLGVLANGDIAHYTAVGRTGKESYTTQGYGLSGDGTGSLGGFGDEQVVNLFVIAVEYTFEI